MNKLRKTTQENLITLLCFDDSSAKSIYATCNSKYFEGDYRRIAQRAYEFIEYYKEAPKSHLDDLIEEIATNDEDHDNLLKVAKKMYRSKDGVNAEWTLRQLSRFAKYQHNKEAIMEAAELLENSDSEEDLERVDQVLMKAAKERPLDTFDAGVRLSDEESLAFLDENEIEALPTGIPQIDRFDLGPARGELHLLIAPSKGGKSWWLTHLARESLISRYKVLYISLENKWQLASQRFYQTLFGIGKRDLETAPVVLSTDGPDDQPERQHLAMIEYGKPRRPKMSIERSRDEVAAYLRRKKLSAHRMLQNLIVKQFPTSKLTVTGLENYLDQLEHAVDFQPDIVLLDYPDLMHHNVAYKREELGSIYQAIRGIAAERNFALATVTQSNREGAESKSVRGTNVAEDWSKIAIADNVFTLSQTDAEHELGLTRLRVDRARNDMDGMELMLVQNLNEGQFVTVDPQSGAVNSSVLNSRNWNVLDEFIIKNQNDTEE